MSLSFSCPLPVPSRGLTGYAVAGIHRENKKYHARIFFVVWSCSNPYTTLFCLFFVIEGEHDCLKSVALGSRKGREIAQKLNSKNCVMLSAPKYCKKYWVFVQKKHFPCFHDRRSHYSNSSSCSFSIQKNLALKDSEEDTKRNLCEPKNVTFLS